MITFEGLNQALSILGQGFTDTSISSESFSKTLDSVIQLAARSDLDGAQILADAQAIMDQLGSGAISAAEAEAQAEAVVE